jgi:hypothetical protein
MISSIRNIKVNFFQLFFGRNGDNFARDYFSVTDLRGSEVLQVPVRYYKESTVNYTEANFEHYPVISVQDFLPKPVDGWNNYNQKKYVRGFSTATSTTPVGTYEVPYSVRLNCRFEVSVATKLEKDFITICDWFYKTFDFYEDATMEFNKEVVANEDVYDSVNYTLEDITDNPRQDGIFEAVFVFDLNLWADIKPYKPMASLFESVKVDFNQKMTLPNTIVNKPDYLLGVTVV